MMKLEEIIGVVEIEASSAVSPVIFSAGNSVVVTFQKQTCDINDEDQLYTLVFKSCVHYNFGMPSNETLPGHPYYPFGLASYGFYEMKDSELISRLKNIDSVHPYHKAATWKRYKHYILTFHENMFECIAIGYELIVPA